MCMHKYIYIERKRTGWCVCVREREHYYLSVFYAHTCIWIPPTCLPSVEVTSPILSPPTTQCLVFCSPCFAFFRCNKCKSTILMNFFHNMSLQLNTRVNQNQVTLSIQLSTPSNHYPHEPYSTVPFNFYTLPLPLLPSPPPLLPHYG